jgi:hypothetical protein
VSEEQTPARVTPRADHVVTCDWHVDRSCVLTWLSGKTQTIHGVNRKAADWLSGIVTPAKVEA